MTGPDTDIHTAADRPLGRGVIGLMAAAAGLFVASIYYNQPLLGLLAEEFHAGESGVLAIPVMTQAGYALGLLFLAPLGDLFERRALICWTTAALGLALALAALALSAGMLAAASLAIGLLATVAQQVVPMAAHLAPENARGRVVGQVMAGLLSGILLARVASGVLAQYWSWRAVFGLAGAATLAMGVVLAFRLPRSAPAVRVGYPRLMLSLAQLTARHGLLRLSGCIQGLLFAAFVAFWTNMALFMAKPPLSLGSSALGLLSLVGVAGVLTAPLAGRMADRRGAHGGHTRLIAYGAAAAAASFGLFWWGRHSLPVLVAAIMLMDVGMQCAMISNQARVYALDASARSRLNTVYMTLMFVCGALGAVAGAHAYVTRGWAGVCVMGAGCGLSALLLEILGQRRGARRS